MAPGSLLRVISVAHQAFHVALLVVHALRRLLHVVRAVTLEAMLDSFRRLPHRGVNLLSADYTFAEPATSSKVPRAMARGLE
jgi:hypothetical protein